MNKVIINMNKLNVVDYDISPKPFQFAVNIPSLSGLTKTIIVQKPIPRKNFLGEKLYHITINDKEYEVTENELNGRVAKPIVDIETSTQEVRFLDKYLEFTLDDIIDSKKQQLMKSYSMSNCILREINLHDGIDYNYTSHAADTGFKLIRLHKNGAIKLKPFEFDTGINKVIFNIEGANVIIKYSFDGSNFQIATSNTITRASKFSTIHIILENPIDNHIDIDSYSLLY
jgi:hypothetical protein